MNLMWPFTQLHPPTVALWGDATKSAESWGKTEVEKIANEKKQFLSTSDAAMRAEQWALNKALHYIMRGQTLGRTIWCLS